MLRYKGPTCTIYRPEKTSEKSPSVKIYPLKCATIKDLLYQHCPKNLRWSELRCITCRPALYNLKMRKKLKTYLIVRIELPVIENTLKGLKYKKYLSFWACLKYVL